MTKVNELPRKAEFLLHEDDGKANPQLWDLAKRLRAMFVPHSIFSCCSVLRGHLGVRMPIAAATEDAVIICWKKKEKNYSVTVLRPQSLSKDWDPSYWCIILYWNPEKSPMRRYADPDIPMPQGQPVGIDPGHQQPPGLGPQPPAQEPADVGMHDPAPQMPPPGPGSQPPSGNQPAQAEAPSYRKQPYFPDMDFPSSSRNSSTSRSTSSEEMEVPPWQPPPAPPPAPGGRARLRREVSRSPRRQQIPTVSQRGHIPEVPPELPSTPRDRDRPRRTTSRSPRREKTTHKKKKDSAAQPEPPPQPGGSAQRKRETSRSPRTRQVPVAKKSSARGSVPQPQSGGTIPARREASRSPHRQQPVILKLNRKNKRKRILIRLMKKTNQI